MGGELSFMACLDTTGAGDTFNGALSVAYHEGKSLHEAVQFANAAAALSTTSYGAQSSISTREKIESFCRSYRVDELLG